MNPAPCTGFFRFWQENEINLEDCYGFVIDRGNQAALVIEAEKYPQAEGVLREKGYRLLSEEELKNL